MELQQGYRYIAYRSDNPLKNFKFLVDKEEDLFIEATVEEGLRHIELWKPYVVKLPSFDPNREYLEITPYEVNEETKKLKLLILGYLYERRKFVRFNILDFGIKINSETFEGTIENISLGGVKIQINRWKGQKPKEGEQIYVKANFEGKDYHFIITPVAVKEDFISAKFEKPARVTSELFYQCLQRLERENAPISEKRKFRRFYVEPLKIIVDTPLGVGYMVDISLKGMKVKLKRTYNVEPDILKGTFSVSCYIPNVGDEYILDTRLVYKTKEGFISLEIVRWNEESLKLISKILELLMEVRKS